MTNNIAITLVQTPIIKHKLEEIGARVTERLAELNLANQVATEDTIKTLKATRAELNKEAKEFEEKRKAIKEAVMTPYNDFEDTYKSEIIDKYKEADTQLKEAINDFEVKVKTDKRNNLIAYFNELIDMEQIDFVKFDDLKIEVNLSTSEKKYKEQILEYIQKVVSDLELIDAEEYKVEILVEFKKTLNASASILSVKQRKQAEKEEAQRVLFDRTQNRKRQLSPMLLTYSDLTRTFNWINNQDVYVKLSDVETLSDEDWKLKIQELQEQTKVEEEKPKPLQAPTTIAPHTQPTQEAKKDEEIFEAQFSVQGTLKELTALSEFLKSNNYNYKNL